MVGLVIVSHSAKLAEGVIELLREAAGPDIKIAPAGGMDLPGQPLGTDAILICQAIERVYSPDGVVVLVDVGSAILSTELALDLLDPAQRNQVTIAPAPLVEGGLAAAVQARLGRSRDAVVAEARTALDAKLVRLGAAPERAQARTPAETEPSDEPTFTLTLTVRNRLGLHARPAARFARTAARHDAVLHVYDLTNERGPADAKSINALATLGVLCGHTIKITARGADAQTALDALETLADANFGDEETVAEEQAIIQTAAGETPSGNELVGLAVSPGIAIGPARLFYPALPAIPQDITEDPDREWARLSDAIHRTVLQLEQARRTLTGRGKDAEAEIFDAQALMLQDDALLGPARALIYEGHANAAQAFDRASANIAAQYEALQDEYQRAREQDLRAVSRQVLFNLLGVSETLKFEPGVLVAPDLTPAEAAYLDPNIVQAVCTAFGAPTGHGAILAKSLGIPAVVGLGERALAIKPGTTLLVDGTRGRVWPSPDAALMEEYPARIETSRASADLTRARRKEPAMTRDGRRVEIAANISSVKDAQKAVELGAEAVGLFRTEFLFLDRRDAPGEDEQYETYRAVAAALEGRPLLIRTLDIGGDKPLPYVRLPRQANPFLGLRGLRLSLAQPELFKTQLRAILRVASDYPVRLMFPMVSVLQEFRDAQALVNRARIELTARGAAQPPKVETGIMVEVPSAALAARAFAREVDFFSIGTNDLTQYTLAVERGNPQVAALADAMPPVVLRLISDVVRAAHAQNKWVGICGEMAGDPAVIPLLVGLDVDELSMSAPLIPAAKQIVREISLADAKELVQEVLQTV